MVHLRSIAIFMVASLAIASGTRMPLQLAPAPAPSSANLADVLFMMEASQAVFTDATTLVLSGLTATAQSFSAGGATAVYPVQGFTNSSAGAQFVDAAGNWLGNPTAVLFGVANGNGTNTLVTLSAPRLSNSSSGTTTNNVVSNGSASITNNNSGGSSPSLTFTVAVLPAQQSSVKYPGGAASAAVGEATQGVGTPLVTSVAAGGQLTDVVLFIDANSQALQRPAATKDWWGGCWGCGNSWSNNNWGGGNSWGWGGNNGWNNGWNNNGWNNNNNNANINNNNVNSNGWSSGSSTNINNNNVNSGGGWGNTPNVDINNNNVGNQGTTINNNNVVNG